MKRIVFSVVVTLLLACTNNEDKAQKLIKQNLFETLDDYNSYEPISFTPLDSLYSDYTMDSTYIEATKLYDICCHQRNSILESLKQNKSTENINEYVSIIGYTILIYPKICDSIKNNYISNFMGFETEHSYRARTKNGNSVLYNKQFIINKDLNDLIVVIDLAENAKLKNSSVWKNGNAKKTEALINIESKYANEKSKRDVFFEENKSIKDIIVLSPTLHVKVISEGTGKHITKGEAVVMKICKIIDDIPQESAELTMPLSDYLDPKLANYLTTQKKGTILKTFISIPDEEIVDAYSRNSSIIYQIQINEMQILDR